MFIYFLNFISNSFITLKFGSKFNPTQDQLIPNQGSTRKKIKEEKKIKLSNQLSLLYSYPLPR
jgi:hypothetical protein